MSHPLISKVQQTVSDAPVVIFMKGTPDSPMCGFSAKACQVLKHAGADQIVGVDVLSDDALWEALEEHTEWPTVPQIFIGGKFVGGCDIVTELDERGELADKIASAKAAH